MQYHFGTDKSGCASCKSGFSHNSGKQPPVGHFPVPTVQSLTSYLEKTLCCFHSNLWYWTLQSGPGRNVREHQRSQCHVAPCVQCLMRGKQILCLANIGQETVATQQQVIHKPPGSGASCTGRWPAGQGEVDGKRKRVVYNHSMTPEEVTPPFQDQAMSRAQTQQ